MPFFSGFYVCFLNCNTNIISTHIDFLIINRVTKEPLLAIETDGYSYHNEQTEQFKRDRMKDHILANYGLPLLRLSTVGHSKEQRIVDALSTYK